MPKKFDPAQFTAELAERLSTESLTPNIHRYRPHTKQYVFHSSQKKKKLYIGGNRSGKTTGGVTEGIWRATCRHPYRPELNIIGPNRGRVVTVDFINGIEKIIFPQYKQWLYPSALRGGAWETAYDKMTRTLNFSNGSTIEFMSYDQDLDKFAGTSRHWIHFDEEAPRPIYMECLARLVDTDGDFWMTMTPVEGMTWVFDELYDKNVNNDDGDVEVIEISMIENPYLNENAIKSFVSNVDGDDSDIRIKGSFVQIGGRIYKNFDPTPGARQVLTEPFDEPAKAFKNWLWIMGLDHGLNNPTAVLWMAVDPNGFCIVFDEHYKNEWTVDQHAEFIKGKIKRHGRMPDILVADPSIQNRNPITNTSIQQEYQKYGLSFTLGNNDVAAGIIRVKKYLKQAEYVGKRRPDQFAVGEGIDGSNSFYRLRITPNCVNLISEMKKYRWKTYTNKKLQYENNPYDQPHKKDDHACDALRYMVMTQPDLMAEAYTPGSELNAIMANLEERIGTYDREWDELADPHDLHGRAATGTWNTDFPIPTESTWEYDEHLGGIM